MTILGQASDSSNRAMAAVYQTPRSKFMIHDILGGNGKFSSAAQSDERTPSPPPAKDLNLFLNSIPENDDDSDCESSEYKTDLSDGNARSSRVIPRRKSRI
jgi:hypothetical protein